MDHPPTGEPWCRGCGQTFNDEYAAIYNGSPQKFSRTTVPRWHSVLAICEYEFACVKCLTPPTSPAAPTHALRVAYQLVTKGYARVGATTRNTDSARFIISNAARYLKLPVATHSRSSQDPKLPPAYVFGHLKAGEVRCQCGWK